MTTLNEPKTPEGLLERCFSTIPNDATYKPTVPRLAPDAGSRARLRWLFVAAAVPVITVSVVLPLRNWLNASKIAARTELSTAFPIASLLRKQSYIRRTSWDQLASPDRKAQYGWKFISPKFYRLSIIDRNKGIFTAETDSSFQKLLEGTPNVHSLTLPNGSHYMNDERRVDVIKKTKLSWREKCDHAVDRMVLYGTLGEEVTLVEKTPKQYVGRWNGQAVPVMEYTFHVVPHSPWEKKNRADILLRLQYFVAPDTGLLLGERCYERRANEVREVWIGEAEYGYAPEPGDAKYLVPPGK